jgi:ACS family sodium-dependent inorganic phosphate cotransporter
MASCNAGSSVRNCEVDYNCVSPQQSASEWQIVFYIASAIYLVGAVVYGLCASGEVQKWAMVEERTDNKGHKEDQCYSNRAMESDAL